MRDNFKRKSMSMCLRYFPHLFRYISYFKYLMYHKYLMFLVGCHMSLPYRCLLFHDIDKFHPRSFHYNAVTFYDELGNPKSYKETKQNKACWLDHQKRNKHHWQAWVLISDEGSISPLPIEYPYAHEMVADYLAFSASTPNSLSASEFYLRNKNNMILHPETRTTVELLLVTYDNMDRKSLSDKEYVNAT